MTMRQVKGAFKRFFQQLTSSETGVLSLGCTKPQCNSRDGTPRAATACNVSPFADPSQHAHSRLSSNTRAAKQLGQQDGAVSLSILCHCNSSPLPASGAAAVPASPAVARQASSRTSPGGSIGTCSICGGRSIADVTELGTALADVEVGERGRRSSSHAFATTPRVVSAAACTPIDDRLALETTPRQLSDQNPRQENKPSPRQHQQQQQQHGHHQQHHQQQHARQGSVNHSHQQRRLGGMRARRRSSCRALAQSSRRSSTSATRSASHVLPARREPDEYRPHADDSCASSQSDNSQPSPGRDDGGTGPLSGDSSGEGGRSRRASERQLEDGLRRCATTLAEYGAAGGGYSAAQQQQIGGVLQELLAAARMKPAGLQLQLPVGVRVDGGSGGGRVRQPKLPNGGQVFGEPADLVYKPVYNSSSSSMHVMDHGTEPSFASHDDVFPSDVCVQVGVMPSPFLPGAFSPSPKGPHPQTPQHQTQRGQLKQQFMSAAGSGALVDGAATAGASPSTAANILQSQREGLLQPWAGCSVSVSCDEPRLPWPSQFAIPPAVAPVASWSATHSGRSPSPLTPYPSDGMLAVLELDAVTMPQGTSSGTSNATSGTSQAVQMMPVFTDISLPPLETATSLEHMRALSPSQLDGHPPFARSPSTHLSAHYASCSGRGSSGGGGGTGMTNNCPAGLSVYLSTPPGAAASRRHSGSMLQQVPELQPVSPREPAANILAMSTALPANMQRHHWGVADYRVLRKMYTGYASTVFQAVCRHSRQPVALKVYHMANLGELSHHQVHREIRLHASLNNEHIIRLYAAFTEGSDVIMVQEFASGGDLYTLLHRNGGRLSERQAVEMVLQPFLMALHYLHTRGITHRDIKPENVLFTEQRILKLADFGLAIDLNEERAVTRAGTLDYMAPEVLRCPPKDTPQENKENRKLQYSMCVDAWAVGVFAYELVVGFPPFAAETAPGSVDKILAGEVSFPQRLSDNAKGFIRQALQHHPGDRPTVKEMLNHSWMGTYQRRRSMRIPTSLSTPSPSANTTTGGGYKNSMPFGFASPPVAVPQRHFLADPAFHSPAVARDTNFLPRLGVAQQSQPGTWHTGSTEPAQDDVLSLLQSAQALRQLQALKASKAVQRPPRPVDFVSEPMLAPAEPELAAGAVAPALVAAAAVAAMVESAAGTAVAMPLCLDPATGDALYRTRSAFAPR